MRDNPAHQEERREELIGGKIVMMPRPPPVTCISPIISTAFSGITACVCCLCVKPGKPAPVLLSGRTGAASLYMCCRNRPRLSAQAKFFLSHETIPGPAACYQVKGLSDK